MLGYSDATTDELHPVCRLRVALAEQEARPDDVVLFSGWARGSGLTPEADLMRASWTGATCTSLVDRGARTTLGNALAVARAARRLGADEVVLVTSRWHARRAATLVRAALHGSGASLRVVAAEQPIPPERRLREAASWLAVPLLAVFAARTR